MPGEQIEKMAQQALRVTEQLVELVQVAVDREDDSQRLWSGAFGVARDPNVALTDEALIALDQRVHDAARLHFEALNLLHEVMETLRNNAESETRN